MRKRWIRFIPFGLVIAVVLSSAGCRAIQTNVTVRRPGVGSPVSLPPATLREPTGIRARTSRDRGRIRRGSEVNREPGLSSYFGHSRLDHPFANLKHADWMPEGEILVSDAIARGQSGKSTVWSELDSAVQYRVDPLIREYTVDSSVEMLLGDFVVDVQTDHFHLYTAENVAPTLAFVGVAATLSYSSWDRQLLDFTQTALPTTNNSRFFRAFRTLGNGYAMLPAYAGSAVLGKYMNVGGEGMLTIGEWGERNVRGILVGTPPLLISQYLLGGSRPDESAHHSRWDFFEDANGVSGHAFMGAIPFLTAYHMADSMESRMLWLGLSFVPAISRVADNAHYPSQSLLGWGLAYLATSAIARTEANNESCVTIVPTISDRGGGVSLIIDR